MTTAHVTDPITGIGTVTLTIVPMVDEFKAAMRRLEEVMAEHGDFLRALRAELAEAAARDRRSAMHAAYRAKTRRRNRR